MNGRSANSERPRRWDRFNDSWGILIILAGWEAWVDLKHLSPLVMPRPLDVLRDLFGAPTTYAVSAGWTLLVASGGLVLAIAVGFLLAIVAWWARLAAGLIAAASVAATCVPVVAFIPLLGRVVGYGWRTDLLIVAVVCFLPVFVLVGAGLRELPTGSEDLFAVLGAARHARLRYLALPAALRQAAVALRMATPASVLGALSAEYLMATPGLGSLASDAMAQFDTARAMGASLIAALLSLTGYALAGHLEDAIRRRLA